VTGRGRVLVVDDERHVRGMLQELVEHLGYEASTAASGDLAIAVVAIVQPHVVLLDLQMPGMSGFEVLAHLRQHHPAVAVILIAGSMNEEIARQANAAGAFTIVGKPFDLDTLRGRRPRSRDSERLRWLTTGVDALKGSNFEQFALDIRARWRGRVAAGRWPTFTAS